MKERLDRQQIHEVCFVVDRFIQGLEREIDFWHPDRSETFCEGSDVLPFRELMKSLNTFFCSR